MQRRAFLAGALLVTSACRRDDRSERCAYCGMRIARESHWQAGARDGEGHMLRFDTPGCLFRYRFGPHGGGLRDPWVTEYYGPVGRQTNARSVRYAIGSDVVGPMGADLVPIDPARAETFASDHHARAVVSYDAIHAETLHEL